MPARQPEGDGMVTATPGLALGILTADCAPVLFADAEARRDRRRPCRLERRAGRRAGSHPGGHGKTGRAARPHRRRHRSLHPQDNYEVGGDFRDRFLARIGDRRFFVPRTGRAISASIWRAMPPPAGAGRGRRSSASLGLCTYPPENGFFSFRRTTHRGEADYGRQISAIVLTG